MGGHLRVSFSVDGRCEESIKNVLVSKANYRYIDTEYPDEYWEQQKFVKIAQHVIIVTDLVKLLIM